METIQLRYVKKEIVFQRLRNLHQLNHINRRTLKDAIHCSPFQMNSPCKLRYAHPAFVEDGFDHLSDMEIGLRGHGTLVYDTKKAWKSILLDARVSTPTKSNKPFHAIHMAQMKLILDLVPPQGGLMWKLSIKNSFKTLFLYYVYYNVALHFHLFCLGDKDNDFSNIGCIVW